MYVYKFEEISADGAIIIKETAIQRTENWLNEIAMDGWELVSFQQMGMHVTVAVRKLVESPSPSSS